VTSDTAAVDAAAVRQVGAPARPAVAERAKTKLLVVVAAIVALLWLAATAWLAPRRTLAWPTRLRRRRRVTFRAPPLLLRA